MAAPTVKDLHKRKRLRRYLPYRGRVEHVYKWMSDSPECSNCVDSNRAASLQTRRSTTGLPV